MIFNSFKFLLFFIITFSLYWKVPEKFSKLVLLLANITFVWMFGLYCLVFAVILSFITFGIGCLLSQSIGRKVNSIFLYLGIVFSVLFLMFFKYDLFGRIGFHSIMMPIGISFYTFKNISYLVDAYKTGNYEKNLINYLNYSLFFPSFSAGPIIRYTDTVDLLSRRGDFNYDLAVAGTYRIVCGLFKKLVIAGHMTYYTE